MTLLIDQLDLKVEHTPLTVSEREIKKEADISLAKLRRDEETKWAQRAKVKHIQEGGNNTRYFHLIANGKHRKKRIFQLEQDEETIVGQQNLKVFITEFYKNLFGAPMPNFVGLREEVTHDISQLNEEKGNILTSPFSEEEVFEAISQMEHNKASSRSR